MPRPAARPVDSNSLILDRDPLAPPHWPPDSPSTGHHSPLGVPRRTNDWLSWDKRTQELLAQSCGLSCHPCLISSTMVRLWLAEVIQPVDVLNSFGREEFISAWTLGWKNKLSHYAAHGLSCTMSLTAFPNFWAAVPLGHYYKTAACSLLFRLHVWTHYFPRLIQQNLRQLGIQVKTTSKLMSFYGLKKWYCTNSTTWLFPRRSQLVHM